MGNRRWETLGLKASTDFAVECAKNNGKGENTFLKKKKDGKGIKRKRVGKNSGGSMGASRVSMAWAVANKNRTGKVGSGH